MPTYNISFLKDNLQQEANLMAAIEAVVPDCIVEKNGLKKVRTYFYSNNLLQHPNLTFKLNREKTSILLSLFVEINYNNIAVRINPIINNFYWTSMPLISRSFIDKLTCHKNNFALLQQHLKHQNLLPQINDKLYDKILEIIKNDKLIPSQELLEIYPDLGKFVVLY